MIIGSVWVYFIWDLYLYSSATLALRSLSSFRCAFIFFHFHSPPFFLHRFRCPSLDYLLIFLSWMLCISQRTFTQIKINISFSLLLFGTGGRCANLPTLHLLHFRLFSFCYDFFYRCYVMVLFLQFFSLFFALLPSLWNRWELDDDGQWWDSECEREKKKKTRGSECMAAFR